MTVDEALEYGASGGETIEHMANHDLERVDTTCMRLLAAEVRRLRAELVQVNADNESGAMAYDDMVKALAYEIQMNSAEAERRVLIALGLGLPDVEAIKALLEFYEQNKAIIADLRREIADLEEQLAINSGHG